MALPAFTIHTAVRQAGKQFAKSANPTLKRWGPTAVGIGLVPALPYMFDHPVNTIIPVV
jgi:fission process protein 1